MDQHRMPELFCGFSKRPDEGPTLYPVACSPQAWAAASVFSLLQACLGLSFDPDKPEIRFRQPATAALSRYRGNQGSGDQRRDRRSALQRYPSNVGVKVVRKDGNAEVVTVA